MCGIVAILQRNSVKNDCGKNLIPMLKRLERRGYDSVGVLLKNDLDVRVMKTVGSVDCFLDRYLEDINEIPVSALLGHTRWATHGEVSEKNAHPKYTEDFAIVQNGIVENFIELRSFLLAQGVEYVQDIESDTDILLYLLQFFLNLIGNNIQAIRKALSLIEGNVVFLILFKNTNENELYLVTKGDSECFFSSTESTFCVSSDVFSLASSYSNYSVIKSEEVLHIRGDKIQLYDKDDRVYITEENLDDDTYHVTKMLSHDNGGLEKYPYHFLTEMHDQPKMLQRIFELNKDFSVVINRILTFKKIIFVACGSSYFAASTAKYWFRSYGIEVLIEYASEFDNVHDRNAVFIFISQSGETMDTINAARMCTENYKVALVNDDCSALTRHTDVTIAMEVGEEMSVAATKSFVAQLAFLYLLAKGLSVPSKEEKSDEIEHVLSTAIQDSMNALDECISDLSSVKGFLFTGRGDSYGVAREGALKMKELAYVYSDAVPCGELKHGTLALVGEETYVIFFLPSDSFLSKNLATINEIYARSKNMIIVVDECTGKYVKRFNKARTITLVRKSVHYVFLASIFVQSLAYKVAKTKHDNIDKPRNLAKCVTVV